MKKSFFAQLLLCSTFAGCNLGPNYVPPDPCVPEEWNSCADVLCERAPTDWWRCLEDPLLDKYIEMAAYHNNDLLAAETNICQARALRQTKVGELFPHVAADVNATRTYFSKNGPVFSFMPGGLSNSATTALPFQIQVPQIQNIYNALIDVTWEIDLFGKRRKAVEAASANVGVSIEERNAILVSILAEVARNYVELRSNQMAGVLIEEYMELLEQALFIAERQFETGYANCLNVVQAEASFAQSSAQLPLIYAQIYQNIYALSVLTGQLPEALLCELLPKGPLPKIPAELAIGVRSDVLRRRPDVRKAERMLAAAVANVGEALASFFPTVTLIGDFGFQSLHINNLLQGKSVTWALAGDVTMPLFQGGKLVGNLHAMEAGAQSAVYQFQQTALTALYEAESALAAYSQDLHAQKGLFLSSSGYSELALLAKERYAKGLVAITDWLNAQEESNLADQELLQIETQALLDLVLLYKALGGGWEPEC